MDEGLTYRQMVKKLKDQDEIIQTYRTLIDNSPDIFYRTDPEGRISFISPSIYVHTGYTVAEAIGMRLAEEFYLFPEGRTAFLDKLKEEGKVVNFETQLKRKDGSIWWASTNAHFYKDQGGNILGVEGITRDISKLKSAEVSLTAVEERFRLAFHTSPDSINLNRVSDGMFIDINQGFIDLTGYTREDVIGKTSLEINIWNDPNDRNRLVDGLMKTGFVKNLEAEFVRKNGELGVGLMSARILKIKDENIILSITRDITERKQSEEAAKKLENQLLQTQKMEALGTLAGGIAHDFNNILGAILGYAQLAQISSKENPKVQGYADQICVASKRAKDLVQQILAFSRQGELVKQPVDIGVIIQEALKLIQISIPSNIELQQNIKPDIGIVEANRTQIQQVVVNLCTNACHAMEKDGGKLTVGLLPVKMSGIDCLDFQDIYPGLYLKLTVADTGHGMDTDTIARIFEPYYTTKEVGKGTGMGLALVHGIIKSHGGDIKVYSEPYSGTTFHILFPMIEGFAEKSYEASISLPKGESQVLFVDDEKPLVDIGKNLLESLGYQVEVRTSANDALEAFRARPDKYDIVITDMTMPAMSGDKLAEEIRRISPHIPIILCTGFSNRISPEKAEEMGINSTLMKPLTLSDLANTVRNVLDEAIGSASS